MLSATERELSRALIRSMFRLFDESASEGRARRPFHRRFIAHFLSGEGCCLFRYVIVIRVLV